MASNRFSDAWTAMAACPQAPLAEFESEGRNTSRSKPSGVADILTIGSNPTLVLYLSDLFQRFRWTIRRSADLEEASRFLENNRAAVAICEEVLPDALWQDALRTLHPLPGAPVLIVVGSSRDLVAEVVAMGGFDALTYPLREAEVIWTVASAWHQWMKRYEAQGSGGQPCSGA